MNTFARLALVAISAASLLVACGKTKVDEEKTAELIQPVARVEMAAAAPAAAEAGGAPKSGEQVVQLACGACHNAGAAGAPKTGDKAAWAPRIALGTNSLYASVINGKGVMPARGGNPALSDDELKAAVDYLVKQAK